MQRYQILGPLGDGAYGTVITAVNKVSGEMVAVKRMNAKFYSWEECMKLREIKVLKKLCHPNIVRLREVVRESNQLHLIFELLEHNLLHLLKEQRRLPEARVRSVIFQVLQGISYVHRYGFFHRDIKPENILLRGDVVKICDFGLAREVRSRPPYTEYVSTRWYRAPEILLRSPKYGAPVDIWAIGVLMAELITGQPLFPGRTELEQLKLITSILGTPDFSQWPDGARLSEKLKYQFADERSVDLGRLFPTVSSECLRVLSAVLKYDEKARPTASTLLRYPFFSAVTLGKEVSLRTDAGFASTDSQNASRKEYLRRLANQQNAEMDMLSERTREMLHLDAPTVPHVSASTPSGAVVPSAPPAVAAASASLAQPTARVPQVVSPPRAAILPLSLTSVLPLPEVPMGIEQERIAQQRKERVQKDKVLKATLSSDFRRRRGLRLQAKHRVGQQIGEQMDVDDLSSLSSDSSTYSGEESCSQPAAFGREGVPVGMSMDSSTDSVWRPSFTRNDSEPNVLVRRTNLSPSILPAPGQGSLPVPMMESPVSASRGSAQGPVAVAPAPVPSIPIPPQQQPTSTTRHRRRSSGGQIRLTIEGSRGHRRTPSGGGGANSVNSDEYPEYPVGQTSAMFRSPLGTFGPSAQLQISSGESRPSGDSEPHHLGRKRATSQPQQP